jgi:hypothetical protein
MGLFSTARGNKDLTNSSDVQVFKAVVGCDDKHVNILLSDGSF